MMIMKHKHILLVAFAIAILSSCERMTFSYNDDVQLFTYTASFLQTKSVDANGIQTFTAGEQVDIWDVTSKEVLHVTLKDKDIANDGKTASFSVAVNPSSDILAVYPGGFSSDCWTPGSDSPCLTALNSTRDGLATAVCRAGADKVLAFTNILSCVSFSSSKTVNGVNRYAFLYGRNGETFPTKISIDPVSGAASACAEESLSYAYTALADRDPDDIRIWVLPELVLTHGFVLKIGESVEKIAFSREVPVPFTVYNNSFIVLGDVDVSTVSFTLEVNSVSNMNGTISFAPSSSDFMYIPCIEKKSKFDAFKDDSEIAIAVLDHYKDKYGVNWKQSIIDNVCYKGSENVIFSGLDADTDYVAFAFAVDEDMNIMSGVTKISFHTSAIASVFSYEDFLGEWNVTGTSAYGDFHDCTWTFSELEDGVSYQVSGLLYPIKMNKDFYVAYFNESSNSVDFPVGENNPGTGIYTFRGDDYYVYLVGLTADQRSVVPFSLTSLSSNELQITGAAYIAGEYHGDGSLDRSITDAIAISSIVRVSE